MHPQIVPLFDYSTKEEREDCDMLYSVFEDLLKVRMKSCDTQLRGKKVFIRMDNYNLAASEIHCNDKSAEGGYIRSGIAYRIPQNISRLRFFVYWNDSTRVDVDLHAGYTDLAGKSHSVGWNQSFRDCGIVFSGDITHSDAAEYTRSSLLSKLFRTIPDKPDRYLSYQLNCWIYIGSFQAILTGRCLSDLFFGFRHPRV